MNLHGQKHGLTIKIIRLNNKISQSQLFMTPYLRKVSHIF